jgi:5-methyltetrahydropteroyltriglutamate--homocysteine methyltransferase
MRRSTDRFLTTHVGRLGHPDVLFQTMIDAKGRPTDDAEFSARLSDEVTKVVREQREIGIDVVNDGEIGKLGWQVYHRDRLAGFSVETETEAFRPHRKGGGDAQRFADYFEASASSWVIQRVGKALRQADVVTCTGPISYTGFESLNEDITNLVTALEAVGAEPSDGFMNATSPGSILSPNVYYDSEEAYLYAIADALREEYKAITDAGLTLQIDDPYIAVHWASAGPFSSKEYGAWARTRIEALNHAIRGIPREQVMVHICWGSYKGPHTTDAPMRELIPLALAMDVGGWSIEAANARHEHEFEAWRGVDLDGRVLLPGVIGHATDTIEHPELVAWRIGLWADAVGEENVIASTDCGLGDRVHPQIEQAKLEALVAGARIASGGRSHSRQVGARS